MPATGRRLGYQTRSQWFRESDRRGHPGAHPLRDGQQAQHRSGFEFPAHRFGGTGGMMNSSGRLQIKYTFVRKNRLDYNFTRVAARCSSGGFGGA
jgi:hypothetical protein